MHRNNIWLLVNALLISLYDTWLISFSLHRLFPIKTENSLKKSKFSLRTMYLTIKWQIKLKIKLFLNIQCYSHP